MKKLYVFLFESPNALPGQLAMGSIGVLLTLIDLRVTGRVHDIKISLAMLIMGVVITSRLPATLHDRVTEKWDEWLLSFGGPLVYGTALGSAMLQSVFPDLPLGAGWFSSVISVITLVGLQLAFTHASQMSREVRWQNFLVKVGPGRGFSLKGILVGLKTEKAHDRADKIVTAFNLSNPDGSKLVESCVGFPERMVQKAAEEYMALLYGV